MRTYGCQRGGQPRIHTYIHVYIHTCIHTYTHACILTYGCQREGLVSCLFFRPLHLLERSKLVKKGMWAYVCTLTCIMIDFPLKKKRCAHLCLCAGWTPAPYCVSSRIRQRLWGRRNKISVSVRVWAWNCALLDPKAACIYVGMIPPPWLANTETHTVTNWSYSDKYAHTYQLLISKLRVVWPQSSFLELVYTSATLMS